MAELWSVLFAVSFAAGLNIYATVLALGLLGRFEFVDLPGEYRAVAIDDTPLVAGATDGLGWFVDMPPNIDETFSANDAALLSLSGRSAAARGGLLNALLDGRGRDDRPAIDDNDADIEPVWFRPSRRGSRWLPNADDIDAVFDALPGDLRDSFQ